MPLRPEERTRLKQIALEIRQQIVEVTAWSGGAHIGGALSMADILTILYFNYLNIDPARPDWPDRDRFVLSKGHGGVGHAVTLAHRGYFPKEDLREFNATGSKLGMHLDSSKAAGVDVSTGSWARDRRPWDRPAPACSRTLEPVHRRRRRNSEGSIWEAAVAATINWPISPPFATEITVIDGLTEGVMSLEPLAPVDRVPAGGCAASTATISMNWQTIEFARANGGNPVVISPIRSKAKRRLYGKRSGWRTAGWAATPGDQGIVERMAWHHRRRTDLDRVRRGQTHQREIYGLVLTELSERHPKSSASAPISPNPPRSAPSASGSRNASSISASPNRTCSAWPRAWRKPDSSPLSRRFRRLPRCALANSFAPTSATRTSTSR